MSNQTVAPVRPNVNPTSLVINPRATLSHVETDILDTHIRATAEVTLYSTACRLREFGIDEDARNYYADVIDLCQTILTIGRVATETGAR